MNSMLDVGTLYFLIIYFPNLVTVGKVNRSKVMYAAVFHTVHEMITLDSIE